MSELLHKYKIITSELYSAADELLKLLSDTNINTENNGSKNILSEIQNELKEDRFIVSVIGEVKKGKSTMLNALLKHNIEICPTDVIELTAAITILKYGVKERAVVTLRNNQQRQVDLSDLLDYVSKDGRYNKETLSITIYLNNPYLNNNIILVDTPGVNSPDINRQSITEDWLSSSDAAIFLVTPEELISESEKRFLLKKVVNDNNIKSILVVINKVDTPNDEDTIEQVNYIKEKVNEFINYTTGFNINNIIPISSRKAYIAVKEKKQNMFYESGFENFENILQEFLVKERGRARINKRNSIIRNKIISKEIDKALNTINNDNKTIKEIEEKIESLSIHAKTLKEKADRNRREVDAIGRSLKNQLELHIKSEISPMQKLVDKTFEDKPNNEQIKSLEKKVRDNFSRISIQSANKIEELFKELCRPILLSQENNIREFYKKMGNSITNPSFGNIDFEYAKEITQIQKGFWASLFDAIIDFFSGTKSDNTKIVYYKNKIEKIIIDSQHSLISNTFETINILTRSFNLFLNKEIEDTIKTLSDDLKRVKNEKQNKGAENTIKSKNLNRFIDELKKIDKKLFNIENTVKEL